MGYTDASHSTWETCPGNDSNSAYTRDSIAAWDTENLSDGHLKPEVDAATVNMGSKWRMPTIEECIELMNNTNYEYVEIDGVKGGKFINKSDASKYIFLPFAGGAVGGSFGGQGIVGDIWSSSADLDTTVFAHDLYADEPDCGDVVSHRCFALSVRGVCENNTKSN